MILKKLIFFRCRSCSSTIKFILTFLFRHPPPQKTNQTNIKGPYFVFVLFRQNHESSFGSFCWDIVWISLFGAPGLIWISPTAGCTKLSQMERFGSAPPQKFDSLTRLGEGKKRRMAFSPERSFWRFSGKKEKGGFSEFFRIFFIYIWPPFFCWVPFLFFPWLHPAEVAITPFPFPYHNIISVFLSLGCKEQQGRKGTYMASFLWTELVMNWEKRLCSILGGCEYVYKIDVVVDCLLVVLVGSCFPWL